MRDLQAGIGGEPRLPAELELRVLVEVGCRQQLGRLSGWVVELKVEDAPSARDVGCCPGRRKSNAFVGGLLPLHLWRNRRRPGRHAQAPRQEGHQQWITRNEHRPADLRRKGDKLDRHYTPWARAKIPPLARKL